MYCNQAAAKEKPKRSKTKLGPGSNRIYLNFIFAFFESVNYSFTKACKE